MSFIDNKKWSVLKKIDKDISGNIKSLHIFGTNADQYIIITKDDTVYSFGSNSNGCLGLGHTTAIPKPTKIEELCGKQVTTIAFSSNYEFVLALANSGFVGIVFWWGRNSGALIGNSSTNSQYKPVTVSLLTENPVIDVKCGFGHSLALTENGDVFMWGIEPGNTSGVVTNPKPLNNAPKIVSIDSGLYHALALTKSGEVYIWGDTGYSIHQTNQHVSHNWSLVQNLSDAFITKISCGPSHCLLLSADGDVYTFGANTFGQCGEVIAVVNHNRRRTASYSTLRYDPQKLNINEKFTDIGAVKYYNISVALTDTGICYVWGECGGQSLTKPFTFPYSRAQSIDDVINFYSKNRTTFMTILFVENSGKDHQRLVLTQRVSDGFNSKELSDFAFKIDGKYVYVYKSQLILRCDYFRRMFAENNWFESDKNEKEINEYSYAVYYAFLKYLYTDTVDIDSKDMIGLLDLANCYLEEELKQRCVKLLKNHVTIDNYCDIYACAVKYNSLELKEYCNDFLDNNFNKSVTRKLLDQYSELKNAKLF